MFEKVLVLLLLTCELVIGMNLTKVLMLSRHNLRTPLTTTLNRMTPKIWPKWQKQPGELTEKGAVLEGFMGEYFAQWLEKEGLIQNCGDSIEIYANTRQRTKDTAIAFARSAFPKCNVVIKYKNITDMDPVFNPVVYNMTEDYKKGIIKEMENKLEAIDLKDAYKELNRIMDIKNSLICKEEKYCDLSKDKDEVLFEIGVEPNVNGPLFIGNSVVDAFLMSYYEGMPLNEIAWGEIKNQDQWKLIIKLLIENQNVRFLTSASSNLAHLLLKYINGKLLDDTKFTVLVGHDSNLSPILKSLGFKSYYLPEQSELTPIGSKLVFQKWNDGNIDYIKVEMVYQSMDQLRNGVRLSLTNPPKKVILEMEKCPIDKNGFCPWNMFMDIINDLVQ